MGEPETSEEAGTGRLSRLLGPYRLLGGNRSLALLFSGQVVSSLGSWLYSVGLVVVAYRITHSATDVALLTFVRLLPLALFLPFGGGLADKVDRKLLMVGADAARALCMFGLIFATSRSTFWLAFPLAFLSAALASLFRPALNATLPALVPKEDLGEANSLMSQMDSLSLIVGPSLGGLLVLLGDVQLSFLVNGLSFLASAGTLLLLNVPRLALEERPREGGWLAETLGGFRFIFRENQGVLAAFTLSEAGLSMLGGAYWTLIIILSVQSFHLGQQGMGFLNAAYGAGGLIGGFATGLISRRLRMGPLYIITSAIAGAAVIFLAISPGGPLPFVFLLISGIMDVIVGVVGTSALQSGTPAELMGRVFGAFESVVILAMLLGSLIAGPLVQGFGVRPATAILGAAGVVMLALCSPWILRLESALGVRIFLRQVPLLASLSRRLVDEVASDLQLESFAPGLVIVRQGEEGDRLYLVKSGEAEVLARDAAGGETHVATIGKLDYFGEIALLRDIPRTATVRARDRVEAYTLTRERFRRLMEDSTDTERSIAGTSDARFIDTQNKLLLLR